MIKVLHIITRMDKGGSAQNTLLTVRKVNTNKFESKLVCGSVRDVKPDDDFIIIPQLSRDIKFFRDLSAFLKLYKIIKQTKPHIVHTHTSKAGILGRWAAKFAGVPIVIHTPHGNVFSGYFGYFMTKLFVIAERISAHITDRIITLTPKGIDQHLRQKIGKRNKYISICSGVEVEKFANAKENKDVLNIAQNDIIIGVVARLVTVKGHRYLLEAMKLMESQSIKLLIIGDGPLRRELEEQAIESGIEKNVVFLGQRKDVPELLSVLDIFVMPSLNEGMGRAIAEAMVAEKPVIASKVGGIPDVVDDKITGILVSSKSPEALANAITYLMKNPEIAAQMGQEGKKKAVKNFGINSMIEQIENLYEELVNRKL
ncbi:MAG: glycosyltransferase family 4 protein [bacterium]